MMSNGSRRPIALVGLLCAMLAGCATQSGPALPDPAVLAAHEWDHGPPWGPEEIPWVTPPVVYDGYPYYWGGGGWGGGWGGPRFGLGLGFGSRRGAWYGGSRGYMGRGGFHGGGGHARGGGGRRGRR